MNWFLFFYLMYVLKTRATTLSSSTTSLRSCENCKFFLPPNNDLAKMVNVRMGRCMLYPYSDKVVSNRMIVGMDEPMIDGLFRYATTARASESMCGHEGVNFIKKPMIPPPPRRPLV